MSLVVMPMLVCFCAAYGAHSTFAAPVNLNKPSRTNFGTRHVVIRDFDSSGEHGSIASSNGPLWSGEESIKLSQIKIRTVVINKLIIKS